MQPEGTVEPDCPYVTGTVTRYCTLTPFTLTDAEREAIDYAQRMIDDLNRGDPQHASTLRGLLERTDAQNILEKHHK